MPNKNFSKIEEELKKTREKMTQEKHRKILKENREKRKKEKIDTRRKILIGEYVTKYFPNISQFEPRQSEAENIKKFEKLDIILSLLSSDKEYITSLDEKATQQISMINK